MLLLIVKLRLAKLGLPKMAAISGVMMSATKAATTAPKAVPMTTATARSTTFPRRMNCLNSFGNGDPPRGHRDDRGGYPTPMMASMDGPVVILGGGSTGEAAAGALRSFEPQTPITLVEERLVGGECSYYACMPSKALLRPPEAIAAARLVPGAAEAVTGPIDVERAFWHRDQVTGNLDDSSQETWLADRDVELVRGRARVTGPGVVEVGDRTIGFERILVATGSVPTISPIPGLADLEYWTNREATSTHEVPERLIVVGAGPVGCELAQAFGRMGSTVTLVDVAERLMPRDHPDAGKLIADVLEGEGVGLRLGAKIERVEPGVRMQLGGGETL